MITRAFRLRRRILSCSGPAADRFSASPRSVRQNAGFTRLQVLGGICFMGLICGRMEAQSTSFLGEDPGVYWWQDHIWSNGIPGRGYDVFIDHDEEYPHRNAGLSLPDFSLTDPEEVDELLEWWDSMYFGLTLVKVMSLGDIKVAATGDPSSNYYDHRYGFINQLSTPGGSFRERYPWEAYGLASGSVDLGLGSLAYHTARAANSGFWAIRGGLTIRPGSEFHNSGVLQVNQSVQIQGQGTARGRLENRGSLKAPQIFGNGSLVMDGGDDGLARLSTSGEIAVSHMRLLGESETTVGTDLRIRSLLETQGGIGGDNPDSDSRAWLSVQSATILEEGASMNLGAYDRLSTNTLLVDGELKALRGSIDVTTSAEVTGELDLSGTRFNVPTLNVAAGALLFYGSPASVTEPIVKFGQLGVAGTTYFDDQAWIRTNSLSVAGSGGVILTGAAKLDLTGHAAINGNGGLLLSGGAGRTPGVTGTSISLSGTPGNRARLHAAEGGRAQFSGYLSTGATEGGASEIVVGAQSRIEAQSVSFGVGRDHDTSLQLKNGGTFAAPNGVRLNVNVDAANTATIVVGGYDGATGSYDGGGMLETPWLSKTAGIGTGVLRFIHRDMDGLPFLPDVTGMEIIESTGPGRSMLQGRVVDGGVARADVGTLVFAHRAAMSNLTAGAQVRGGNMVVSGSDLRVTGGGFSGCSVTSGTLSVVEGGAFTTGLVVSGNGVPASVVVDGAGSRLIARQSFAQIGYEGTQGTLEVRNQGQFLCDTSTTSLRIGGQAGSTGGVKIHSFGELRADRISVGYQGQGSIEVDNMGKIFGPTGGAAASMFIGDQPGSRGFVKLSGLSEMKVGELRVGSLGSGELSLPLSSTVTATGPTIIGHSGSGFVTVGPLSNLRADGGLTVGHNTSSGHLKLNGGLVRVGPSGQGPLVLGETTYGTGTLSIEGQGGTLFASRVTTGTEGAGRIVFNHDAEDLMFRTPISGGIALSSLAGTTTLALASAYVSDLTVTGGQLRIANGTQFSNYGFSSVGNDFYVLKSPQLVVTGAATLYESERDIEILQGGMLNIRDGARVSVFGGMGKVTIGRAAAPGQPALPGGGLWISGTNPGVLAVSSVDALGPLETEDEANALIVFDHASPAYSFTAATSGNLGIYHRGPGTTVIPGVMNHQVDTMIVDGTLVVNGNLRNSEVRPTISGTLAGKGSARTIVIENGGTLSPGDPTAGGSSIGTFRSSLGTTFGPGGKYKVEIGDWFGVVPGTHWDRLYVAHLANTATAASPFVVRISGRPANFSETAKSIAIVHRSGAGSTFPVPSNIVVDDSDFPGTGTWSVRRGGAVLYLDYTPGTETPYEEWARMRGLTEGNNAVDDDPDKDGMNNLAEFSFDGDPRSGADAPRLANGFSELAAGSMGRYFTVPVRRGAVFSGSPPTSLSVDGVVYRIEASEDLSSWTVPLEEMTGAAIDGIHAGMPRLSNDNWTYRSFIAAAPAGGKLFFRARVQAP